ncbi:Mavicyanin [Vitis vinifera]|uniref:Mavicyanin n=1 Tax=Vitis vinifera TaxID=29760 RepID=A0A438CUP6_VITVI|nr:Mavicyanin [Vitis vinifera]
MKNTNMVSSLGVLFTALIVLVAMNSSAGAATEFRVGDGDGWRKPRVTSGSSLMLGDPFLILCTAFEYKNDSVLVVDKWDFYHCNSSSPISSFKNGKSVIKLERPGSFYFISGDPEHCKSGQRLVISVMALHPISQSPPAIALPPGNYFPISPSPSPLSSSGVLVSATLVPLLMAFIANLVGLV